VGPLAGTPADVTVAVSLSGADVDSARYRRVDTEPHAAAEWFNRLMRGTSALLEKPAARTVLSRLGAAESEGDEAHVDAGVDDDVGLLPKLGSFEVMNRSIDIMQAALARHQLAAYPPDVLVEVPRTSGRSLDFHRAVDLIGIGRKLAAEALDSYERQRDSTVPHPTEPTDGR
jgi:NTE family protein